MKAGVGWGVEGGRVAKMMGRSLGADLAVCFLQKIPDCYPDSLTVVIS